MTGRSNLNFLEIIAHFLFTSGQTAVRENKPKPEYRF